MVNNKNEFRILLKLRRQSLTKKERRAFYKKKVSPPLYPLAIEHSYAEDISNTIKKVVVYVLDKLEKRLPSWVALSDSTLRLDAVDTELEELLKEVEEMILLIFAKEGVPGVLQYIDEVSNRIFGFAKEQWAKQIKVVLGMPFEATVSWWPEVKTLWMNENHRLIKSLSQEYITKLNTLLVTGFQSGWTFEQMVEEIKKLSDKMVGYRARLLARDQIGKINYQITRKQMESIGIDGYLWFTARDERVRGNPLGRYPKAIPSHWVMDSLLCQWQNPTVYSEDDGATWLPRTSLMPMEHPGQPILCRCTAAGYFLPILKEVDKEIEEAI